MNKSLFHSVITMDGVHIRSREDGSESRTIEGYAVVFNTPSLPLYESEDREVREIISSEAVTRALLDRQDIMMTMYHNNEMLLARSVNGKGSLTYEVDERGVKFAFEAPDNVDGERALSLVRRGDISGCSFAFSADYWGDGVKRESAREGDKLVETYVVREIEGIYDFTLASRPAYPATSVKARDLADAMAGREREESEERERMEREQTEKVKSQVAAMRAVASIR